MAGMIAKYLAMSFAMENVVSAPRVISNCLPISTISMNLVGSESRSTMFPASLAADVPVFMATPTSACARAGASLVPSPVIATSLPPACSALIKCHLVLWGGLGEEVVDAGLICDGAGGQRVVTGDHDRSDAHSAHFVEPLAHAGLDDVFEMDHPEGAGGFTVPLLGDHHRRTAGGANAVHDRTDTIGGSSQFSMGWIICG